MTRAVPGPDGRVEYTPTVGDVVILRRAHACGADRMAVTAVGIDVRLACSGCGAPIVLSRERLRSRMREVAGSVAELRTDP